LTGSSQGYRCPLLHLARRIRYFGQLTPVDLRV
jgi:hypothetical protein